MAYFPDANLGSQYSVMLVVVVSKHTKSTGNAISMIFTDASIMKLPVEDSLTEKINPFNHLPFTLNSSAGNNLTFSGSEFSCSLPKPPKQKPLKGMGLHFKMAEE